MAKGSSKLGGATTTNPKVEKTINQIVKKTAGLKKEQYRIVDENGNVIFQKQGVNDRVEMTVGEKREYLDGATSIHNHPEVEGGLGGTFSSNDIRDFGYGAREIVVASKEGQYRLKNMNYGKPNQMNGWLELQNKLQSIQDGASTTAIMKKSNEIMAKTKVGKQMHDISAKWVKRKAEGASQSELDGYLKKYDSLDSEFKSQLKKVRRKLLVQPSHDFLKAHASEYGFKYTYPKGAY